MATTAFFQLRKSTAAGKEAADFVTAAFDISAPLKNKLSGMGMLSHFSLRSAA